MQNRYAGDIGDYGKLGLLRSIRAAGVTVGVNWYLVPDENHNGDGRFIGYLSDERFRDCDEDLWLRLQSMVQSGRRRVSALEDEGVLEATFYSELLIYAGQTPSERGQTRRTWHGRALACLKNADLVFLDPDNGLLVPSAQGTARDNKYVQPREIQDYWRQGASVVYYQHKGRLKDDFYTAQYRELIEHTDSDAPNGFGLKFKTTSQRYYFFLLQPRHRGVMNQWLNGFMQTQWRRYFQRLDIPDNPALEK